MSAKAVIDLEHLARYTGGNAQVNAEIFRLFDVQANELVAKLRSVLDARDAKSWREITHTIKGAARGIGAFDLADAAARCEPIAMSDRENAVAAIAALQGQSQAVQATIKAYLAR